MYQDVTNFKPLFLSEEETMALLDLCLTSSSELDEAQEQVIHKLTELARKHLRDTENGEREGMNRMNPMNQGLTPITMTARSMARSHAPRRQMDTALVDSRRRLRKSA